jgi:pimeloyl-[acyl-carrier protein] methyl ester esterase
MRVLLLPGMDGTGLLFKPLLEQLPGDIETEVISYPVNEKLSYEQLAEYVTKKLPTRDDYLLVAESFSGPIAFQIAQNQPSYLKSVIFVASFLHSPRRFLTAIKWLPFTIFFHLPIPKFIIRGFLLGKEAKNEVISLFKESLQKYQKEYLRLGCVK